MAYFSDRPCEIDKATALAYLKEGSALEIGELADKVRRKPFQPRILRGKRRHYVFEHLRSSLPDMLLFQKGGAGGRVFAYARGGF